MLVDLGHDVYQDEFERAFLEQAAEAYQVCASLCHQVLRMPPGPFKSSCADNFVHLRGRPQVSARAVTTLDSKEYRVQQEPCSPRVHLWWCKRDLLLPYGHM